MNELRHLKTKNEEITFKDFSPPTKSILSNKSTVKLSKRKPRVKTKKATPVLFPGDPRLDYAKRYFDAANSGDKNQILSALQFMAVSDVVLVSTFSEKVEGTDQFMPKHVEVEGMEAISTAIAEVVNSSPDVVLQVLSKDIQFLPLGHSLLICRCSLRGTKMFVITGCKGGTEKVVLSAITANCCSSGGGSVATTSNVTAKVTNLERDPVTGKEVEVKSEEAFGVGGAATDRRVISVRSITTFHMNADKKVFRIETVKEVVHDL